MSEPDALVSLTRPAAGDPVGALVLFHGRGADERDLYPLLDALDPERRLLGVTPRAPLSLPPGGAHWYAVYRIGYPDAATFGPTFERASRWLDELAERTGIGPDRTILGGFSQGAVMSFALGLGAGRPRPAGILALSGFVPSVPGFEIDLETRPLPRVALGHGSYDDVISVEFSRRARSLLEQAGFDVLYREYPLPHAIDPHYLPELRLWIAETLAARQAVAGARPSARS